MRSKHALALQKGSVLEKCPYCEHAKYDPYFSTGSHVISEDAFLSKFFGSQL
jgi:hypothetical protein